MQITDTQSHFLTLFAIWILDRLTIIQNKVLRMINKYPFIYYAFLRFSFAN